MRRASRVPRSEPAPATPPAAAWIAGLAAVLAVKLAVVAQLRHHPLLAADAGLDTTAYVTLARRVLAGDWALGPGLYYVSPLYIYFLAGALAAGESLVAVRVMQAVLGTATVALIYLTTRIWFGARAAALAAGLAGATGLFTFYEVLILQSALDAFLTAAALWALALGLQGDGARRARLALVAAGIIFGAATLNRPNMLAGGAAVIAASVLARRPRVAALLLLGVGVGLAPAIIRNAVVARQFSLVSSHGGLNFYIGNNERATGFYAEVPGVRPLIEGQAEDARSVAAAALGRPVTDAEASAYFRDRGLTWIREQPVDAAALFATKLFYTFHAQHVALPHSYPFFVNETGTVLRFLRIGPWLLVPLGLVGLAWALRRLKNAELAIWLAFVPGYAVGVAAFFVAERYRLPLLVPLSIGSGFMLEACWRAVAARRTMSLAWPAIAGVVLGAVVNWPLPSVDDGRWTEGLRMAQRLVILQRFDEAGAWTDRLEQNAPRRGQAQHGVGMQLVLEGHPERAIPYLKASLDQGFAAPDDPEIWLRLGRLAARREGAPAAEPFFRRAAAIAPASSAARQQLGLNLIVQDRIADAHAELAAAVRLDPGNPDSLAHLGYCEIKLGRADESRVHVRAALARDPSHALARQLAAALGEG